MSSRRKKISTVRSENCEKKEEAICLPSQKKIDATLEDVESIKKGQFEMLERISGFTAEQAKEYLLGNLENELTHEKALKINEIEAQLKEDADQRARNLFPMRSSAAPPIVAEPPSRWYRCPTTK